MTQEHTGAPTGSTQHAPLRQRPLARHVIALLVLAALMPLAGCGSPRDLGTDRVRAEPPGISRPTSSLHYRDYSDADHLARAMRWSPEAAPMLSAHRGGPTPGYPENAIETFENALNFAPLLVEMDVRRTVDGRLILMHDETLDRTTTGTGRVDQTTFRAVRALRLVNAEGTVTSYRVPTLDEALAWADGRAVLMLDVKRDVPMTELLAAVRAMDAFDRVGVIVYSLEDAQTVARLAPEALISISADSPEAVRTHLDALDDDRLIAFVGVRVPDPEVTRLFHEAGIRTQAGTFGETDRAAQEPGGWTAYAPYLAAGADVLATDNVPAAAIAIQRAPR